MRDPINIHGTTMDLLILMSEGNVGAVGVLAEMAKTEPKGLVAILHLDEMNIRGAQVWVGYKEHCDCDVNKFIEAAVDHDADLVAAINNHPGAGDDVATIGRRME